MEIIKYVTLIHIKLSLRLQLSMIFSDLGSLRVYNGLIGGKGDNVVAQMWTRSMVSWKRNVGNNSFFEAVQTSLASKGDYTRESKKRNNSAQVCFWTN